LKLTSIQHILRIVKVVLKGLRVVLYLLLVIDATACGEVVNIEQSLQETVELIQVRQTGVGGTLIALTQTEQYKLGDSIRQTENAQFNLNSEILQNPSTPFPSIEPHKIKEYDQDAELETRIKASKILLFENLSGSRQVRYAKRALDEGGYFYLDVGSATGWFKDQLLSNEDWDLVIAAAEARKEFGGEYFEYLHDQVNKGAALIIEFWDIDNAPEGRIKPLLNDCGVNFQSDWFDPDMRSIFWLKNDHPLLNDPNKISNKLREAQQIWRGDKGDLLMIDAGKKGAEIIAGTSGEWVDDHGTLVYCMEGRMVIQTFSSHEYAMEDMIALWQNYIYKTLRNHHKLTFSEVYNPAREQNESETTNTDNEISNQDGSENINRVGDPVECGPMVIEVPNYPVQTRDMFEHHAEGVYMILDLEISNRIHQPIQIWDEDYSLEGFSREEKITFKPDKAASGYLYIENPVNLNQDLIKPGGLWRTKLAFDINPEGSDWTLVVKPGDEIGQPICTAKISISQ
jgi:hypothetical protein